VQTFDLAAALRGEARFGWAEELVAFSILRGEETPLSAEDAAVLLAIPADRWVAADGVPPAFVQAGLVLTDGEEGRELRARDEHLTELGWDLYGALYHAQGRWRGVVAADSSLETSLLKEEDPLGWLRDRFGGPPPPVVELGSADAVPLPRPNPTGGLFEALERRVTTRRFDGRGLSAELVGTILWAVFGYRRYGTMAGHAVALRRTSPSGGALHPVEAYPLVIRGDALAPGLYHYAARRHELEPIRPLDPAEAESLAERFAAGQSFVSGAAFLIVLAARFARTYWKYKQHPRAYGVVLMDAAHLSQTFALVCAGLGLGAFVTAVVNASDIDDALGLDGFADGGIALLGCGYPAPVGAR